MITLKVKKLRSLKDKSIGLIGASTIYPVYFTSRWGIHTFGVPSPIDVIVLNDKIQVMKTINQMLPNRICIWNPRYKHVVELASGQIAKLGIHIGDTVALQTTSPK